MQENLDCEYYHEVHCHEVHIPLRLGVDLVQATIMLAAEVGVATQRIRKITDTEVHQTDTRQAQTRLDMEVPRMDT